MGAVKPRVLNKYAVGGIPPGAVFVGRPGKWGNPYIMGVDGTRTEVILRHREWILGNPEFISEIKKGLRGKDLVCFCAPKDCHADLLLEIANQPEVPDEENKLLPLPPG